MSGTIVIDAATFVDVRTIDFLRIVEALRAEHARSAAIDRLLVTVDEYGLNMICADQLDAAGLASFAAVLETLRHNVDDDGIKGFLADLTTLIGRDERLRPRASGA